MIRPVTLNKIHLLGETVVEMVVQAGKGVTTGEVPDFRSL
jgi:hypothetical protein